MAGTRGPATSGSAPGRPTSCSSANTQLPEPRPRPRQPHLQQSMATRPAPWRKVPGRASRFCLHRLAVGEPFPQAEGPVLAGPVPDRSGSPRRQQVPVQHHHHAPTVELPELAVPLHAIARCIDAPPRGAGQSSCPRRKARVRQYGLSSRLWSEERQGSPRPGGSRGDAGTYGEAPAPGGIRTQERRASLNSARDWILLPPRPVLQ